ncbi:hypothetical protein WICPIJ_009213 [Wickerhamomyces pijperi]|uniref:phosphoserine transaminase n=1 Tax=Wickerhamomyces pijperi TaxID=599730 RepID=A0A9P8PRC1_WICPI|nr:hypothetical protein WICPIJ_009213 [Wickerhamomyces pijperi]
MSSITREEPNYFGAGPAYLPTEVLQQAAQDLVNYHGANLGIGEISHRDKRAINVVDETKQKFIELYNIPDTHEVLFLQGGGHTGFSSIATNLLANFAKRTGKKGKGAYAVTGSWSAKAVEEAQRLGVDVEVLTNSKEVFGSYTDIQPFSEWKKPNPEETAYVYYCDNETVHGVEFPFIPQFDGIEVAADMSSNILSKQIDISKFGLIFAGAQKNVGLAGVTIYIIKKTLIEQLPEAELRELGIPVTPIAFHYPTAIKQNSLHNTLPIFTVQILNLVLAKLIKDGSLPEQEKRNDRKSSQLYQILDKHADFYNLPVAKGVRSEMNIVFTMKSPELEAKFLKEAEQANLTGLKGHRSVGGLRASLYNAITEKSATLLAEFVDKFATENK